MTVIWEDSGQDKNSRWGVEIIAGALIAHHSFKQAPPSRSAWSRAEQKIYDTLRSVGYNREHVTSKEDDVDRSV